MVATLKRQGNIGGNNNSVLASATINLLLQGERSLPQQTAGVTCVDSNGLIQLE